MRVIDICDGIGGGVQPQRVRTQIAGCFRIVVAVEIVVEARFGVEVLAGEAERSVGGGVSVPGGGAPEGGAGAPGYMALLVDEFRRGADEVRDDAEESLVDFFLWRVGRGDALELSERVQAAV